MQDLGKKVLIFDGGFGSEIEKLGLSSHTPEELNITHSEEIIGIHKSYKSADFISTNTFGLNRIKYKGEYKIKDLALKAIKNAKTVGEKVFFDIGPTGAMLKPIGLLDFDDAYEAFKEIVLISKDYVDGYIAETFSDLYELKACILAIKENSNLPVFATMTFDQTARTLTGSTPEIMVSTLEGLGVDALGVNCSLGPKDMEGVITRIINTAHIPVIIQPNRGLPKIKNGKTYYDLELDEFINSVRKYVEMGVSIVGGCCGTTPEFIEALKENFKGQTVNSKDNPYKTIVNSATSLVEINNVVKCGERLNPTGKKKLKNALLNEDYEYLIGEAIKQADLGCDLLDLNVGIPKIDEKAVMKNAVLKIQEFVDLPLQIDSSNIDAIESGCRYYNGIPLINSVNGEAEVMDKIFPIAKKYGAVVLGLTLDKNGVPKTAEERFEIAKRIINRAQMYGISKDKIMIDTLVLTASAEQDLVKETLKALTLVRGLGVKTALGVSNVSFGLPNRGLLNKTFLSMAMYAGLNMPILNPQDSEMMSAISAYNVLLGIDKDAAKYIENYQNEDVNNKVETISLTLFEAVKKGIKHEVEALTKEELNNNDPMYIINEILIKALSEVGKLYDSGKIYLPQLISAAEAAKISFGLISSKFPKSSVSKATIILCTVLGDVHDIGKNICKVILESYGYNVIDLGKDTPIDKVIDAYYKYKPFAIGLSALMTTTVINMEDTIKALRAINCDSKIFVGGAVVTADIATEINADYYAKDAQGFVNILEEIVKDN